MKTADLRLKSKSFRFYFEDTKDLKPIDVVATQYLIQKIKLSVKNTETKDNNYNFYRNDNKIKGYYYETNINPLVKDIPCKTSASGLKSSLNRLQNRYGIIFKHKTIKGRLQIFMPLLDDAVSDYFDKPYQTSINPKLIKRVQNKLTEKVKKSLVVSSKKAQWRVEKEPSINNHITNNRITNNPRTNYHTNSHEKQLPLLSWQKSVVSNIGLKQTVVDRIVKFLKHNDLNKDYGSDIINKIIQAKNKTNKQYQTQKDKTLAKFETNGYFKSHDFSLHLDIIFQQIDHNTDHNTKYPKNIRTPSVDSKDKTLGYIYSELQHQYGYWLEDHTNFKDHTFDDVKGKPDHETVVVHHEDSDKTDDTSNDQSWKPQEVTETDFSATGNAGDYPKVIEKDYYTVINSQMPDDYHIVIHNWEHIITVKALREKYQNLKGAIDNNLTGKINQYISRAKRIEETMKKDWGNKSLKKVKIGEKNPF